MIYREKRYSKAQIPSDGRIEVIRWFFILFGASIILRLFFLQIISGDFYTALASGQHEIYKTLFPQRGEILVEDNNIVTGNKSFYPLATNKEYKTVYAQPRYLANFEETAKLLSPILEMSEDDLKSKLNKPNDPYEVLKRKISDETVAKISALNIEGIKFQDEVYRFYPEGSFGAHVLGFVASRDDQKIGQYGIEGYFENILKGKPGILHSEKDLSGRWISSTQKNYTPAVNGSDVVLTIDKTIQYFACKTLSTNAKKFQADSASLVIMDPFTGAIVAMCSYPDFDPNEYNKVDSVEVYNNSAIFEPYEIGSVFKPITMAGALDLGYITPETTYVDTGEVKVDRFTIRNHDKKAHGQINMIEVLNQSLNTGTIFVIDKMGKANFKRYVEAFGFGELTGINIETEMAGNISSLEKKSDIYHYTDSFGQGITATPLQMVQAFGAIANGGFLMRPYIVKEIRDGDDVTTTIEPKVIRKVIEKKTSTILGGMMAAVVTQGTGKVAGVKGYTIAGKTGTAQIPDYEKGGYSTRTNQSFIGFGPLDDPRFVMMIKYEDPKASTSGGTATATFSQVAEFMLDYWHVPPEE